jgi:chaperone required for assembly of F1-ATPase
MSLNVTLRARWRRALTSLTSLALASLHHYSFCLCSQLLSLLHLEHSTRSDVLTLLTMLLLLALIFCT